MKNKPKILQKNFEALLTEAVENLYLISIGNHEIYMIIEKQFGVKYADKYCTGLS